MTQNEVCSLLGEPVKVDTTASYRWIYGVYPYSGEIIFSANGEKVERWSEPTFK